MRDTTMVIGCVETPSTYAQYDDGLDRARSGEELIWRGLERAHALSHSAPTDALALAEPRALIPE